MHGVDADDVPRIAPCDAEHAVCGERGHHGIEGIAETAKRADVDLIDAVEEVKRERIVNSVECILNDGRIVGKEGDK